jgi:HlyD family secretion protein
MKPQTKHRFLFAVAICGVLVGFASAFLSSRSKRPEPPVFNPAPNPYPKGIYANGIVESYQSNGQNINIYPEVGGVVTEIRAREGQAVKKGDVLFKLDDSVQRANVAQLKSQAEAAHAVLDGLKAQPRKEVLQVAAAQVSAVAANLKNVTDQLAKVRRSYRINPRSVSKFDLDNAFNAVKIAQSNLEVVRRQYDLTRAGAWVYDILNQEKQFEALTQEFLSAQALLEKYTIRAPADGVILSVNAAQGSFASPQGAYATYSQAYSPVVVMGTSAEQLAVRVFVDEILVNRLPDPAKMSAQMSVRGTDIKVNLEYERTQPYITPKIELSDQRLERVDVRVLPMIFKFKKPPHTNIFPGQLVDVYLGEGKPAPRQFGGEAFRPQPQSSPGKGQGQ